MDNEQIYDSLTYRMSINLFTISKEFNYIPLKGYDEKNPEHQWLLYVAKIAQIANNKHIRMDINVLKRWKVWSKYSKTLYWIKRIPKSDHVEYSVQKLLDDLRPFAAKELGDPDFNFGKLKKYYGI